MSVKMLAEKAGPLQGMTMDSIARQAYGGAVHFMSDPSGSAWPGYVGAFVRQSADREEGEYEVLDYVLEFHDAGFKSHG